MYNQKLPADPTATVLGIIALFIIIFGCCCGLAGFPALILSIIGLIMANKSLRLFAEHSEEYTPQSRSNVYIAKVLNIIALVISSLFVVFMILYFALYGTLFSTSFMEGYRNGEFDWEEFEEESTEYNYEEEDDIWEHPQPESIPESESDSSDVEQDAMEHSQ